MTTKDWLPRKDQDLSAWAVSASAQINGAPVNWGVTAAQAADFVAKAESFSQKLAAATDGNTRGKLTVHQKNEARALLVAATRPLIRQVQEFPGTTDDMRVSINIPIHKTHPTPASQIYAKPQVRVRLVDGRQVLVEAVDAATGRGRLPEAAEVRYFTATGVAAPTDPLAYTFQGATGRTTARIDVPGTAATTLFVCAQWANARGPGPACQPIAINIAGELASPVEAGLKLAA